MSSVNNLADLLTNVNPVLEAGLLGSQAEFSQLGNIKPFTIDKVNQMSSPLLKKTALRVYELTVLSASFQAFNTVQFEMSDGEAEPQEQEQEAGMPLKLSINRPFFFSVIEEHYDSFLLMGKVTNPTA